MGQKHPNFRNIPDENSCLIKHVRVSCVSCFGLSFKSQLVLYDVVSCRFSMILTQQPESRVYKESEGLSGSTK